MANLYGLASKIGFLIQNMGQRQENIDKNSRVHYQPTSILDRAGCRLQLVPILAMGRR